MSDKIEDLNNQRRKKNPQSSKKSIEGAIKRAKQHIRNVGADDLEEPEGLVSGGDMNEFVNNPEAYDKKECEKEKNDEQK